MFDWKNVKAFLGVVVLVAAGILYFAPMSALMALAENFNRHDINQEMLFQKKVILLYEKECAPNAKEPCSESTKQNYLEAEQELEDLRDRKKALGK